MIDVFYDTPANKNSCDMLIVRMKFVEGESLDATIARAKKAVRRKGGKNAVYAYMGV